MKKTTKLISLALTFCMVLALGIIGVLAVQSLNLEIGGNINFTAQGIKATISKGTTPVVGGELLEKTDGTETLLDWEITTAQTATEMQNSAQAKSWSGLNFKFGATDTTTLNFTITNDADEETEAEEYIYASFGSVTGLANNASIVVSNPKVINPGQTEDFSVSFKIADQTIDASITDFVVEIKLERLLSSEVVELESLSSDYGSGEISYSDRNGDNLLYFDLEYVTDSEIEIPSFVKEQYSDQIYIVTEFREPSSSLASGATKLVLPKTLRNMYADSFYCSIAFGCADSAYTVYENCRYLGSEENPYLFLNKVINTSASSITIHPDCVIIGPAAFSNCSQDLALNIPDSVNYLGSGSVPFKNITIGTGLSCVSEGLWETAIYGGPELIDISDYNVTFYDYNNGNMVSRYERMLYKGSKLEMPSNILKIGNRAYTYMWEEEDEIIEVHIPSSVVAIGGSSPFESSSLSNLWIDSEYIALTGGQDVYGEYYDFTYSAFENIYIKANLAVGDWINDEYCYYTLSGIENGYAKYVYTN